MHSVLLIKITNAQLFRCAAKDNKRQHLVSIGNIMTNKSKRITVRVTENQALVLKEIKDALGVSYSMLTRTIILDFLQQHEDRLNTIVEEHLRTGKTFLEINDLNAEEYADNSQD